MGRFRLRGYGVLLVAWGALSCGEPSTSVQAGSVHLALSVAFAASPALATDQRVDNVHVVVSKPDESVVKTLDVAFPPAAAQIPIGIDVPMTSQQEVFIVAIELREGGVALYGGSQEVTAERGHTTAPVTIELSYIGPTAQVTILPEVENLGIGRVVSVPAGIDCAISTNSASGSCAASFATGTSLQLTASTTTFSGFYFAGWSGACSGTGTCALTAGTTPISLRAGFAYDPCLYAAPMTTGSTVSGDVANTDCQFANGQYADYYYFTLASQQLLAASLTSTVQPELLALIYPGTYWYSFPAAGATATSQTLLLPPGTYELGAGVAAANTFGSYRLTLAPADSITGCQGTRTTFGLSAFSTTLGRNCPYTTIAGDTTIADGYLVYVPSTKTLSVTVSSASFSPLVEFRDGTTDATLGAPLKSSAGMTGSSVTLSMTGGGFVEVWISSQSASTGGGPYTLTIAP